MSRLERREDKHTKKMILEGMNPGGMHRSVAEWERLNARIAKYGRPNVIYRLKCQTRGCRERVGYVEFTAEPAPTVTVMIRALWHRWPTDDPRVWQRYRLLGATDPKVEEETVFNSGLSSHPWPSESVLQIGCRLGHEWSEFTKADIARRAAAVLV